MSKRTHWYIVTSYGAFLGWLLSFPYNGPILEQLALSNGISPGPLALVYTVVPVLFLIGFAVYTAREGYARLLMLISVAVSALGTILLFLTSVAWWWFVLLGLMGICSVLFIVSWSSFYTRQIPLPKKMGTMALVIVVGNIIYYLLKLSLPYLTPALTMSLLLSVLGLSFWSSRDIAAEQAVDTHLESEPFPFKLVLAVCAFLFVLKINGGLTSHVITPALTQLHGSVTRYYGMLPYILTLIVLYYLGGRISRILPVYLGTSLLGISYVAFFVLSGSVTGYFITETLLQGSWAMLHLFWWTLLGEIASLYGRPMKISSMAFVSNLLAMFLGGALGLIITNSQGDFLIPASGFALIVVLTSFLIVPWLLRTMEQDLIKKVREDVAVQSEGISIMISLPYAQDVLTPRELEVAGLLLQGHTNKDIARELEISENTLKTHARNIYAKMSVANKRELLQLAAEGVVETSKTSS